MRVMIGIPTNGTLDVSWVMNYHQLARPTRPDGSPDWCEAFVGRQVIHLARNLLVSAALDATGEAAPDYLFMLDDDTYPDHDVLLRLLSHQEPIVSGVVVKRTPPHTPASYRLVRHDDDGSEGYVPLSADDVTSADGGLLEVDAVGGACLLVHRSVFERMRAEGMTPFQFLCGGDGRNMSEDIWFCEGAKALGYRILLDTGARCGHAGKQMYRFGEGA